MRLSLREIDNDEPLPGGATCGRTLWGMGEPCTPGRVADAGDLESVRADALQPSEISRMEQLHSDQRGTDVTPVPRHSAWPPGGAPPSRRSRDTPGVQGRPQLGAPDRPCAAHVVHLRLERRLPCLQNGRKADYGQYWRARADHPGSLGPTRMALVSYRSSRVPAWRRTRVAGRQCRGDDPCLPIRNGHCDCLLGRRIPWVSTTP